METAREGKGIEGKEIKGNEREGSSGGFTG